MSSLQLTKSQKQVILTVTFGNILEWFEIYLYIYWAPSLAHIFFDNSSSKLNLFNVFLIFGAGFLARPLGAILFGRYGDRAGRKKAFTLSIIVMTIPTVLMGVLPTYAQVGIYAPILLCILRLGQAIPSAGEAPGAFCFLYEDADENKRRFMTSWGGFGNQIGAILAVIECFLMDHFMSHEFLISWGWRISFWTGGLIGLLGICLRYRLHETDSFTRLEKNHRVSNAVLTNIMMKQKKAIGIGVAYSALNASTFYLIASYIPTHFNESLGLSEYQNFYVTLFILVITTILLPFFGRLGDIHKNKPMLVACALLIIFCLYPLYIFINNESLISIAVVGLVCIIPITCITALLPYLLTHLFPTNVRFTGVALSFNIADGIIGGFTPAIGLFLFRQTGSQAAFLWFILLCGIVSLISFLRIKE